MHKPTLHTMCVSNNFSHFIYQVLFRFSVIFLYQREGVLEESISSNGLVILLDLGDISEESGLVEGTLTSSSKGILCLLVRHSLSDFFLTSPFISPFEVTNGNSRSRSDSSFSAIFSTKLLTASLGFSGLFGPADDLVGDLWGPSDSTDDLIGDLWGLFDSTDDLVGDLWGLSDSTDDLIGDLRGAPLGR